MQQQVMRFQLPARPPLQHCGRQVGPQARAARPLAASASAAASTDPPGLPALAILAVVSEPQWPSQHWAVRHAPAYSCIMSTCMALFCQIDKHRNTH